MTAARMLCLTLGPLLIGSFCATAQDDAAISAVNFLRVNEEVCTGGQPSVEDIGRLKDEGVRSILNLRHPSESPLWRDVKEETDRLGLNYFNIPVDTSDLRDDQVDEFLELVDDENNRPIFIHCTVAGRVGGFWMIYRVLKHDWSFDEAEAREIGLRGSVLPDFARRYIEKNR